MHHWIIYVDLPKARKPLLDLLVRENADAERRLALDIRLERDLRAGKQANRNMRLADGGEAARDRVVELRHNQFVFDFCGS